MNNDELEKLKKRLYRKEETFEERKFRPLKGRQVSAKTYWEEPVSSEKDQEGRLILPEKPKMSLLKKIIIILTTVFVLAAIVGLIYLLTEGPVIVSSKNIEIKFEGPLNVKGGELNSWQVSITNKNKKNIELADLIIEYPQNSKPITSSISGSGVKTLYERRPIGKIKAGETVNEIVQAYLFGEKNSEKKFRLSLEYRAEGSNAILEKTTEQLVRLLQSPIEISVKMPKETNAGEVFPIEAEIISNSAAAVQNINLKIEYPAGFKYIESDSKPISGDNIWKLGDLNPNQKRVVKIKGILEGQDQMELTFHFLSGPLDEKGEIIAYGFNTASVVLKKPFLNLAIKVNGKEGEAIASGGERLQIEIDWQNTLPVNLYNAVIEAKLKGAAIDQRTISVDKGFYRSFDQTLVWNQVSFPGLEEIEPLASNQALFDFSILSSLPSNVIKEGNPIVTIEVEMRGERITEEGKVEIKSRLIKEIKIATLSQLSQKGLYYSGPFKNSGFLPPKVGKETTYTIIWSLNNTVNNVDDAVVSAFLPPYVRWLGVIKPEGANVSYNQTTGEVIWRPGVIARGAGIITSAPELAFQISFLPSVSQIGSQPILVSEVILRGKDSFTGAFLKDVKPAITTYLDNDPQFKYNEATVVQ